MVAYYNENNAYAAQWLRNLVRENLVAPGEVDERSIVDVRASEIKHYTQHHFFAGIGGWSVALRLAGWPDDKSVWTGSCPCQPFSNAGAKKGFSDERHLWPEWFRLAGECRPAIVFGEQVAGAIKHGWLDLVFSDLEGEGYACGAAVLPACSVGAPHIRQRCWFVADAGRLRGWAGIAGINQPPSGRREEDSDQIERSCAARELGDANGERSQGRRIGGHGPDQWIVGAASVAGELGQPDRAGCQQRHGPAAPNGYRGSAFATGWADCDWLPCADGKARPTQSGIFPLAHGVQRRAPKLRAYGNAIVPQVAAEFIKCAANA